MKLLKPFVSVFGYVLIYGALFAIVLLLHLLINASSLEPTFWERVFWVGLISSLIVLSVLKGLSFVKRARDL